jgi:hypothetical protein
VQRIVLVIGMGSRLHEDRGVIELAQDQSQRNGAVLEIDRAHAQLRVQFVVTGFGRTEYREHRRHDKREDCASGIHCFKPLMTSR